MAGRRASERKAFSNSWRSGKCWERESDKRLSLKPPNESLLPRFANRCGRRVLQYCTKLLGQAVNRQRR